jgi:6-phosphogluconolactonase (cycloisomerase 2 family)
MINIPVTGNGTVLLNPSVLSGTGYQVYVSSQPTGTPVQYCAAGPEGNNYIQTAAANVAITCINQGRFVYSLNGTNHISGFAIDQTPGVLTAVPNSPFTSGNDSVAMAIVPSGQFAYAVNQGDATISAYAINRSTGSLTLINGSPFATGSSPSSILTDPTGRFLYAGTTAGLYAYTINGTTGSLTPIAGSPFNTFGPFAVSSTGNYLFGTGSQGVATYGINQTSGALSLLSSVPIPSGATPLEVAAFSQNVLYYSSAGPEPDSASILTYTVDAATGALAGPIFYGTTLASVNDFAINPAGTYIYFVGLDTCRSTECPWADLFGNIIPGNGFDADYMPTEEFGPTEPVAVTWDPSGRFRFIAEARSGGGINAAGGPYVLPGGSTAIAVTN